MGGRGNPFGRRVDSCHIITRTIMNSRVCLSITSGKVEVACTEEDSVSETADMTHVHTVARRGRASPRPRSSARGIGFVKMVVEH